MIETVSYLSQGILPTKGFSAPAASDRPRSPFQDMVQQELVPSKTLDTFILNFLIKTIRSICSTPIQGDPFPLFPALPFSLQSPSRARPEINPSHPETLVPLQAHKPSSQEFDQIIQQAANEFGVEPELIKAVISVESNGNPQAVSPAGAQGLMQLMPKTAADLGVTNPFDPAQNIRAGTRYLSQLQNRYQGDLKLTLAAYNWGMGNLEKKPEALPRETRNYIARVEKHYQTFQKAPSLV
ncbi:MAG: hypothetical protein C0407_14960 [Desulfobacca sp.]|nr:hypothetical protein [Desulfobacca sp.]